MAGVNPMYHKEPKKESFLRAQYFAFVDWLEAGVKYFLLESSYYDVGNRCVWYDPYVFLSKHYKYDILSFLWR